MTRPISYLALLRGQPTFRRIWLGDVVSLAGDWFTTISLFAMLLDLTGRGEVVGFALIARFLPAVLFGPLAGVLADRLDRRTILVACDLLRAVVVLGYLLVRSADDVWLVYLLQFVQLSLSALFDPTEQASVASVVRREEIVTANALQGITWSAMLAVGALLGGAFAHWAGRDAAFVMNSLTYLGSAAFLASAKIPRHAAAPPPASWKAAVGFDSLVEGLRFVGRERGVLRVLLAKAGWGFAGGGAILLYSVFGQRVFPIGADAATGIGVLYASRGVGALIGPTLARHFTGDTQRALDRTIGVALLLVAASYVLFSASPWLPLAALALVFAHMGAATIWTYSTSLLNLRVPDRMRGRIFAADLAINTVAMMISTAGVGYGLDHLGWSPRSLMLGLGVATLVPAILWWLTPSPPAPAPLRGEG